MSLQVFYQKKFLKDLADIPAKTRKDIEKFVFETVPPASSIAELHKFEKMSGYDNYYKARFGNYRVGAYCKDEVVEFKRVLNRKEIYRYFP